MFNIDLKRSWYEVLKHLNHFKCEYSHVIPSIFHLNIPSMPHWPHILFYKQQISGAIDKWIHLIFAPAPNLHLCRKRDIALPQWRPPWRTYAAGAMIRDVWMLWRSKWSKMYPYIYGWWLTYGNLRVLMNGMIGVRFQNVCNGMCGCRPCLNSSPEVEGDTQKADNTPNSVLSSDDEKNRPAVQFAHSSVPGRKETSRSFQGALAMFISKKTYRKPLLINIYIHKYH